MRKRGILIFILLLTGTLYAQEVNWASKSEGRNLLSAFVGADYSSYYGISYGKMMNVGKKSFVAGTEVAVPFGKDFLDDWRWKTSIQTEVFTHSHFSFSVKPAILVKRYESPLARMVNLGADVSAIYGYQRAGGGIALLVICDRSVLANVRHNQLKQDYPEIRDGWYSTRSGNLKLGTRLNYTRDMWSAFLTIGKHYGQDF